MTTHDLPEVVSPLAWLGIGLQAVVDRATMYPARPAVVVNTGGEQHNRLHVYPFDVPSGSGTLTRFVAIHLVDRHVSLIGEARAERGDR